MLMNVMVMVTVMAMMLIINYADCDEYLIGIIINFIFVAVVVVVVAVIN